MGWCHHGKRSTIMSVCFATISRNTRHVFCGSPALQLLFFSTMSSLFVCLNVQKTEEEVNHVSLSRDRFPTNTASFFLLLTLLATSVFFAERVVCVHVCMFSKLRWKSVVLVYVGSISHNIQHMLGGSLPWQLLTSFTNESFVSVSGLTQNGKRT